MIAVQCCLQWWQSANCWEVSPVCRHGQTSMKGVDSLKLLFFFFSDAQEGTKAGGSVAEQYPSLVHDQQCHGMWTWTWVHWAGFCHQRSDNSLSHSARTLERVRDVNQRPLGSRSHGQC